MGMWDLPAEGMRGGNWKMEVGRSEF